MTDWHSALALHWSTTNAVAAYMRASYVNYTLAVEGDSDVVWELKNDAQRASNVMWISHFSEAASDALARSGELHPLLVKAVVSGYRSIIQELQEQVDIYDKAKEQKNMTQVWYEVEFEVQIENEYGEEKIDVCWACFTTGEAFSIQDAVAAWLKGAEPVAALTDRLTAYEVKGKPTGEANVYTVTRYLSNRTPQVEEGK